MATTRSSANCVPPSTRHAPAFPLAALLVALCTAATNAAPEPDQLLQTLEKTQASIDRFSCTMHLVKQFRGKSLREGKTLRWQPLEPADYPPAENIERILVVDGERYSSRETLPLNGRTLKAERTWDGKVSGEFNEKGGKAYLKHEPRYFWGANIYDPRAFAFRPAPDMSLLDVLRDYHRQGKLTVRDDTLNGKPCLLADATSPADSHEVGYRLWLDATRNHMPLQVEILRGQTVYTRFTDIELKQVAPGVWFPIKGNHYQIEPLDPAILGTIRVATQMTVDLDSLTLSPKLADDTFTLHLPEGVEAVDVEEYMRQVRAGKVLPPGARNAGASPESTK